MKHSGVHWRISCILSRLLCGKAYQPLCARVYAAHPSICRSVFLFLMDLAFSEYRHCEKIHSRYVRNHPPDHLKSPT